ncbi:hypothetical protein HMPREF9129_0660 [Peptoniphilus indolicus ATCC 29427]|uniref:Uncharacterized protein n=1 Tax=Peptoniphilus indolicus ATCC 29427 TaxID=997350 RepID=G4D2N0_9FIRM|nr:hypothetical protein HMPREF9129_0660 [Peptoniphilus indolicus ATCC 29427]
MKDHKFVYSEWTFEGGRKCVAEYCPTEPYRYLGTNMIVLDECAQANLGGTAEVTDFCPSWDESLFLLHKLDFHPSHSISKKKERKL